MRTVLAWLACLLAAACGASSHHAENPPTSAPSSSMAAAAAPNRDADLDALVGKFLDALYAFKPYEGVHHGLHQYDGKIADRSAPALAAWSGALYEMQTALQAIPDAQLSAAKKLDKEIVLGNIRGEIFEDQKLRVWHRSLFAYAGALNLTDYLIRDYAPLEDRARAVIAICNGTQDYLANELKNLDPSLPKPWVNLGMMMAGGTIDFAKKDAKAAFATLADAKLKDQVNAALDGYAQQVAIFQKQMMGALGAASETGYALGPELFLEMLKETEGIELDLPTLEKMVADDTQKNLAALADAAKQIDPKKPMAEVIGAVAADVTDPAKVIDLAKQQVAAAQKFVVDHKIVGVPSSDVADVKPAPPFMRFNPAFLSSAGVFEPKPLPSYYLISLPDPSLPADKQKAMLMPTTSMLYTAVHEVWPGHFVDDLHLKQLASKPEKVLCSGVRTEGWAHYTEQMMWDAGFGAPDPKAHVGQLLAALMRDARFQAAILLHAKGGSLDDAAKLFQDVAFMPKPLAMQQAVRGTIDPMYLEYTLGKLMIQQLKAEWEKKTGKDDAAFHDAFLDAGCEELPIVREVLMGGTP